MKHEFELLWGLPVPGSEVVVKRVSLRPLTIGAELRAQAAIEEMDLTASDKTTALMAETLAYWAQQLTVEGIVPDQLTGAYLMENLTGEDYAVILAEQEAMRVKFTAAGANQKSATAAEEKAEVIEAATETTGNP